MSEPSEEVVRLCRVQFSNDVIGFAEINAFDAILAYDDKDQPCPSAARVSTAHSPREARDSNARN